MAFFPDLNTQEGLATDTPEVRRDQVSAYGCRKRTPGKLTCNFVERY